MSTVSKLSTWFKAQVGYHEGRSGGHWNNQEKYAAMVPGLAWVSTGGQPWCATFVAAGACENGVSKLFPLTASCDVAGAWYKEQHRWSEYPAVGAQVFYGTPADLNHTGFVVAYDADTITTVEGNTNDNGSREGDGVYLKHRNRRDANVVGYGYPMYPEGIDSADPAYRTAKPAPKPVRVVTHPVADRIASAATGAAKSTHGARQRAFARVARIIAPFTTKK